MVLILAAVLACPPGCSPTVQEPCACLNVLNDLGDEDVNLRDLEVLVLMVGIGSLDADINCDGDVNADDVGDWITTYFMECAA